MKYTQIPTDTFKNVQLNAGVLLKEFSTTDQTVLSSNIIGATSGGVSFTATPTYVDFGDDIDNCPKNTKELKKLDTWEAKLSGTFSTITASAVKQLLGAADTSSNTITPRNDVKEADFDDVWWVGDYSDVNTDTSSIATPTAGYVAIHLKNALSSGGFQLQSSDKEKGKFSFEYTAHYSIANPNSVPFEIFVVHGVAGTSAQTPVQGG